MKARSSTAGASAGRRAAARAVGRDAAAGVTGRADEHGTGTDGAGHGGPLLVDEPFAAPDAITRDVLQGELLRVRAATGTTIAFRPVESHVLRARGLAPAARMTTAPFWPAVDLEPFWPSRRPAAYDELCR